MNFELMYPKFLKTETNHIDIVISHISKQEIS